MELKLVSDEHEWSCGHVARSVCKTCHEILIEKANRLSDENEMLRDRIYSLSQELDQAKGMW
jgi:predicted metal-binding protein